MVAGYAIYQGAASRRWCVAEIPDGMDARRRIAPPKSDDRWFDTCEEARAELNSGSVRKSPFGASMTCGVEDVHVIAAADARELLAVQRDELTVLGESFRRGNQRQLAGPV